MLYGQPWYLPFLIATVLIYWAACRTPGTRKLLLIGASLTLLASIQAGFTAALIGWTVAVYLCGRYLQREDVSHRLTLLVFAILGLVGYLSFFKYLPVLLESLFVSTRTGESPWLLSGVVLPLGISYFTFRFLHYLINAYRGQLAQYAFIDFMLYSLFFPILPAGPIERIERFIGNASSKFDADDMSYGVERILIGATKKLLLVDTILITFVTGEDHQLIVAGKLAGMDIADVWIFLGCSFLYAYLDFSAYSDLAIGTSRLFGYRICENFVYPIFRRNLSEFWKHWHMSLSQWCRDYIYMPVLGQTRRPRLALYASMMTIGAWHFINFNWLVWGALHATGLVCVMEWQRMCRRRKFIGFGTGPLGYLLGMLLTFAYVSWVFSFVAVPSPVAATRAFIYAVSGQVFP